MKNNEAKENTQKMIENWPFLIIIENYFYRMLASCPLPGSSYVWDAGIPPIA